MSGDFELWISRPDYDTPLALTQVDSMTGPVLRTLPVERLAGLNGLEDFASYEIRTGRGALVAEQTIDYCPNNYLRQRVSDDGPLNPRYPYFCGGGPFVKGQVWGIDHGWASDWSATTRAWGSGLHGDVLDRPGVGEPARDSAGPGDRRDRHQGR